MGGGEDYFGDHPDISALFPGLDTRLRVDQNTIKFHMMRMLGEYSSSIVEPIIDQRLGVKNER